MILKFQFTQRSLNTYTDRPLAECLLVVALLLLSVMFLAILCIAIPISKLTSKRYRLSLYDEELLEPLFKRDYDKGGFYDVIYRFFSSHGVYMSVSYIVY